MNPFKEFVNTLEPIDPTEPPSLWSMARSNFIDEARATIKQQMEDAIKRLAEEMARDLDAKIMNDGNTNCRCSDVNDD